MQGCAPGVYVLEDARLTTYELLAETYDVAIASYEFVEASYRAFKQSPKKTGEYKKTGKHMLKLPVAALHSDVLRLLKLLMKRLIWLWNTVQDTFRDSYGRVCKRSLEQVLRKDRLTQAGLEQDQRMPKAANSVNSRIIHHQGNPSKEILFRQLPEGSAFTRILLALPGRDICTWATNSSDPFRDIFSFHNTLIRKRQY